MRFRDILEPFLPVGFWIYGDDSLESIGFLETLLLPVGFLETLLLLPVGFLETLLLLPVGFLETRLLDG